MIGCKITNRIRQRARVDGEDAIGQGRQWTGKEKILERNTQKLTIFWANRVGADKELFKSAV